jgi:hypothetical protein
MGSYGARHPVRGRKRVALPASKPRTLGMSVVSIVTIGEGATQDFPREEFPDQGLCAPGPSPVPRGFRPWHPSRSFAPWPPPGRFAPGPRPPFLCSAKEKGGKERRPHTALAPRLRRGVPCGARKPAPARTRGVRFAHSAQTGWPSQKGSVPAARGPSCCAPRRRRRGWETEQPNTEHRARCLQSASRGSAVLSPRRLRRRGAQTRGPRAAGTRPF